MTDNPPVDESAPAEEDRLKDALAAALGADFDVRQRLGTGSMAVVYQAWERGLERTVAVKVLLPGRADDEEARKRFEREAKSAASLTHPNVVQVYRFGRLPDETPYLIMRYVKGRTMEERLEAEGRLSPAEATQVLTEVTSALAAAHERGIVHRDVRPANILWDREAKSANLSDFGIAGLIQTSGEETTRLTKTGQMLGDPKYLSPEQLMDGELTEQADMYAVGVLGYELLTGEGPYDATTNTQWIQAHLSGTPRDLKDVRPDVDPAVADLLKRCLNREPKHRPSAEQASKILQGDTSALPVAGAEGIEDPLTLQGLFARRVPQFVGAALTAGAGFVGFVFMLYEAEVYTDRTWFLLSLPFASCAVAAATVVAWFHGERGRQEASIIEWVLLSLIGVAWVAWSAAILVSGG